MADLTLMTFDWVPEPPRGFVRDLRVRWALEEMGQAYATRLYDRRVSGPEDRMQEQPFGQVPAFRDGDVAMFESGAICLHLAERSEALLPTDPATRALAQSWTIAALASVEPYISMLQMVCLFDADKPGAAEFAPSVEARLADRLDQLAAALGESEWLTSQFTVADVIMITVLRQLWRNDRLESFPKLAAYVRRGEARPAFQRALAAQLADFESE